MMYDVESEDDIQSSNKRTEQLAEQSEEVVLVESDESEDDSALPTNHNQNDYNNPLVCRDCGKDLTVTGRHYKGCKLIQFTRGKRPRSSTRGDSASQPRYRPSDSKMMFSGTTIRWYRIPWKPFYTNTFKVSHAAPLAPVLDRSGNSHLKILGISEDVILAVPCVSYLHQVTHSEGSGVTQLIQLNHCRHNDDDGDASTSSSYTMHKYGTSSSHTDDDNSSVTETFLFDGLLHTASILSHHDKILCLAGCYKSTIGLRLYKWGFREDLELFPMESIPFIPLRNLSSSSTPSSQQRDVIVGIECGINDWEFVVALRYGGVYVLRILYTQSNQVSVMTTRHIDRSMLFMTCGFAASTTITGVAVGKEGKRVIVSSNDINAVVLWNAWEDGAPSVSRFFQSAKRKRPQIAWNMLHSSLHRIWYFAAELMDADQTTFLCTITAVTSSQHHRNVYLGTTNGIVVKVDGKKYRGEDEQLPTHVSVEMMRSVVGYLHEDNTFVSFLDTGKPRHFWDPKRNPRCCQLNDEGHAVSSLCLIENDNVLVVAFERGSVFY
eukprot:PhF_6_TR32957/c0_g1_i2/m.48498